MTEPKLSEKRWEIRFEEEILAQWEREPELYAFDAAKGPAVVVDTTPTPIVEDAWTFRFLVPTVLVVSGLALVGALAAYGVRVRGRYRVAR